MLSTKKRICTRVNSGETPIEADEFTTERETVSLWTPRSFATGA